jgi:hypothetical protein
MDLLISYLLDAVLILKNERLCKNADDNGISCSTVYIFYGIGDSQGNLMGSRSPNFSSLSYSGLQQYQISFVVQGSTIIYRNTAGKIYKLEFYYEFVN